MYIKCLIISKALFSETFSKKGIFYLEWNQI